MKQLITITLLGMMLGQNALADYFCLADQGEKLHIKMEEVPKKIQPKVPPAFEIPIEIFAGATLTTGEVTTAFQANGTLPDGSYNLLDGEGNPATLQISQSQVYGGRCGRCGDDFPTPAPTLTTYAKLTYQQNELNFTCP
ncbi:hypothetical protein [Bdellovibrio sp. HCB337]|uniref:hypothetical protein n=1 Tax=Bdellovibrio sp. HCB337 TaxID=3394358 RepID=UPI0039A58220